MDTSWFKQYFFFKISSHVCIKYNVEYELKAYTVRTTRPEKSDIFTQRYQSQPVTKKFQKHCYNIFLTFRNNVKIFLSQNIMHNSYSVVYHKNTIKILSVRTDRTDKTAKMLIRLLLEEQCDQDLHCLSFYLLHLHIILQRKPKLLNFGYFQYLFQVFQFLEVSA